MARRIHRLLGRLKPLTTWVQETLHYNDNTKGDLQGTPKHSSGSSPAQTRSTNR